MRASGAVRRLVPGIAIAAACVLSAGAGAGGGGHGEGAVEPGSQHAQTFADAGTFAYHCQPHPWMKGTVTVTPSQASSPGTHDVSIMEATDPDAWGYAPASLTIAAGETVVWTNEGNTSHTVTLDQAAASGGHGAGSGDDASAGSSGPGLLLALGVLLLAGGLRRRR